MKETDGANKLSNNLGPEEDGEKKPVFVVFDYEGIRTPPPPLSRS